MKPNEPTGHKQETGNVDAGLSRGEGAMPMGMTGGAGGADPDQKSTHNSPKTVESTLPDGSPKFADPGATGAPKSTKRGTPGKAGKYEAVNRFTTKIGDARRTVEPGEVVELEADEAASLGDSIKPAK